MADTAGPVSRIRRIDFEQRLSSTRFSSTVFIRDVRGSNFTRDRSLRMKVKFARGNTHEVNIEVINIKRATCNFKYCYCKPVRFTL